MNPAWGFYAAGFLCGLMAATILFVLAVATDAWLSRGIANAELHANLAGDDA